MSHCKICDLLFIIFCLFCFVLYVNPQNFFAKSIAETKDRNAQNKKQLDEKENQDKLIYACLNRTQVNLYTRYSKKGLAYTHAVKQIFSYNSNSCEMRTEEYYLEGVYYN